MPQRWRKTLGARAIEGEFITLEVLERPLPRKHKGMPLKQKISKSIFSSFYFAFGFSHSGIFRGVSEKFAQVVLLLSCRCFVVERKGSRRGRASGGGTNYNLIFDCCWQESFVECEYLFLKISKRALIIHESHYVWIAWCVFAERKLSVTCDTR